MTLISLKACPRCHGDLRPNGDDLTCPCGYRGDGELAVLGTKPGRNTSHEVLDGIRTMQREITVYRLRQCWTTRVESESFTFGYTYEKTGAAARTNGRLYKLQGLLGVPNNIWPHEANPRKHKWPGPMGIVNALQELRDAIAQAICDDLDVEPHEIMGLRNIINADTDIRGKWIGSSAHNDTGPAIIIASYCLWPRGGQ